MVSIRRKASGAREGRQPYRFCYSQPAEAGLEVLMHPDTGLPPLMLKTVAAATDRSKALRNG